jgi:metallophosphoesterase (TIGR03767 family)
VSGAGHTYSPVLTTHRRLGLGPVIRRGGSAPYRQVVSLGGEPHQVRDDLTAPGAAGYDPAAGRPLTCLVHVTDLQLADVSSPARFEFLNRYFADPRYSKIVPVQRPQEALTAHAIDAMLRTISTATGPVTGMPPQLAVTTGDAIDNAQWNELRAFLALFDGGTVTFGGRYAGVQARHWPDDIFWKPDGDGHGGPDIFRQEFGFPHHPGLLEHALRDFRAAGLPMGWLSCFGNHEALNQGVGVQTPGLAAALAGGVKPVALPDDFDHDRALEIFTERPEALMAGPGMRVAPDADRRPITRGEFVAAHFQAAARPAGHGFTQQNLRDGTAYYVHDTPAIRLIALDTACLAGGADGCIDLDQARWLETALAEVHSAYQGPDGEQVRTGNDDKLVVLFSHHGIDTLTNSRLAHHGPEGVPLLSAPDVLRLLHRFRNVVLWLNGHTHTNSISPRRDPMNPASGFWEVTTCALVDWPCQTRLVEFADNGRELAIVCTMVDHGAPLSVASPRTGPELASLHRELAANMPFAGADSGRDGSLADRNVVLRIAAPFDLRSVSSS